MNRRKFFTFAAAAPIAGKAAAEKAAAELSNVSLGKTAGGLMPSGSGAIAASGNMAAGKQAIAKLLAKGIPEWKDKQIREQARNIYAIDPNISGLKSVSLVGKCSMQAGVNYERGKRGLLREFGLVDGNILDAAEAFRKKYEWWL